MKPICIPCHRFFRCIKTGFYFTEGMPKENARPGTIDAEHWGPYKIWAGDKWRCEGCGAEIVSGFGKSPLSIQHEKGFEQLRKDLRADKYQVNDC